MPDMKARLQRTIDTQKQQFRRLDACLRFQPEDLELRRAREEALNECVRLIEQLRELNESECEQTSE